MKSLNKINYWTRQFAFSPPRTANAILRPEKKAQRVKASTSCSGDSCSADGGGGCNSNCR